jgi:hypothetical protein
LQCIFSDPIIYPVPSHDLHFQHQMVLPSFFVFQLVVIDIGGIVDHYCFNFLFITYTPFLYDHYQDSRFQDLLFS